MHRDLVHATVDRFIFSLTNGSVLEKQEKRTPLVAIWVDQSIRIFLTSSSNNREDFLLNIWIKKNVSVIKHLDVLTITRKNKQYDLLVDAPPNI